ncbi:MULTISPECIES: M42 family metallopeptidase [Paenibacillus]|uniref:Aminopeptidase n=1 Tax=Paenibacillus odorifer TaxID=189426 RepID=A0A1R0WYM8_9BACL|nr:MULTISPECIES: M42 family metallopeptidase [Paenibacillus]AIQ73597.1 aminopeptidase [Paenibacillus odorifer]AWV36644.1 aminopeptidase [Paenibacillus odorifer]MEC0134555.1 M42 family metallopeptidase [Paenibacillus odorifer]MEC0223736.1 M42 family metallopeptidase [Paenibacillus odorifer]OMD04500.1 aminopeptidase [Paenibacillus odorifer]
MTIQPNEDYILSILKKLLDTPSPSGFTAQVMTLVAEEAAALNIPLSWNEKGGVILNVPGLDPSRTIGISAHVDTLGAMVRSIKANGTLRLTSVGGFAMHSIENEYCTIHTRSGKTYTGTILTSHPSVHVYPDARDFKRSEENMEVRIDELVSSKEDVLKLGISVGDFISFDARAVITPSGYIKSRHLDDKASVAALLGLLESIKREGWKPLHNLSFLISNYEEVGHGTAWIPGEINEMIAVDMGAMGDDLSCKETDVSICAKDSSGPYDYVMTGRLIELAEALAIPYAVDIYPMYGSDASAALRGGNNIRAALIGPGVHASHSMERTHKQAVVNTAKLLAAYVGTN